MRLLAALVAFILMFPLAGAAPALHAYHSTITELRYNAAKKQLELSVKVFTDDFEKALSQGQPTHVNLTEAGPRPLVLASAYLRRTLQVSTTAGVPLQLQVLGMQAENDGYWFYCKVPLPGPVSKPSTNPCSWAGSHVMLAMPPILTMTRWVPGLWKNQR